MAKYYLIGELHGTNEASRACWDIMQINKVSKLALEFPSNYQKEVDEFLKNKRSIDKISIFNVKHPHDGRASPAIKKLLLKAKEKAMKVYFVDSDSEDISQREKEMTKNIMKIKDKVAFLCGDAHASKKEIHLSKFFRLVFRIINLFSRKYPKFDKVIKTCGSYLPAKNTISYRVASLNGGKFYNFKIKSAGKYKFDKENKFSSLPIIIKSKDSKYDFLYVVEKFTASQL